MTVSNLIDNTDLLSPEDAGAVLGVSPKTLATWRSTRRYPLPYVKVGRVIRYKRSDVSAFVESRTVEVGSASHEGGSIDAQ